MKRRGVVFLCILCCGIARPVIAREEVRSVSGGPPLAGTQPWVLQGDVASRLVDGVDRFLLRQLQDSIARRQRYWHRDPSSREAYERSVKSNRERLAHILGVRAKRVEFEDLELIARINQGDPIGKDQGFEVYAVRWPAFGDVHGEGLLLENRRAVQLSAARRGVSNQVTTRGRPPVKYVIAIPDADQSPEELAGLAGGIDFPSQFARRLAESGCRVVVPALISRALHRRNAPGRGGGAELSDREYLYRSAYELGRHLIGYEVQKVLALVDWALRQERGDAAIGVIGYGEGAMIALYAGALDPRIDAVGVSGYFDSRQRIWEGPISRNVFGLLDQFGDAEIASLVAPRTLIVEASKGPELTLPGNGGAPAVLRSPRLEAVRNEVDRARGLVRGMEPRNWIRLVMGAGDVFGSEPTLRGFLHALDPKAELSAANRPIKGVSGRRDTAKRQERQIHELDRHNQWLLRESPYARKAFMGKLDLSSPERFSQTVEDYRDYFAEEVVGRFGLKLLPFHARTRKAYDADRWTGYEVVLDVFEDVIAYGFLLLPKDLAVGERRPVVVCQHGLEGRPQDVISGDHPAYHDFAARLADRGFITFAPQNLYLFHDRFRSLQRKAYPLKKTLFSIIVPQHQQIVNWLKTLPNVDPERIAFYGLSYGGKTAMRVPPLVPDYCLSICAGDFNDWVWKNASTRSPYSYVWSGEYEIFEFDLGSTFNYAEMATLIAPRPFMVERGHFDGVAPDETVAYEFAKVRFLYEAKLGMGDRCEIEWFSGPHTIHGQGTFDFLRRHLRWPKN